MFYELDNNEDYLYHFTKNEIAIEKILFDKKIRFSPFIESSDPKEFNSIKPTYVGNDEIDMKIFFELADELNKITRNKFKVGCFCKDDLKTEAPFTNNIFLRGFGKSRMWNQYGDNHKGVCLILSKEKLIETIRNNKRITFFFPDHVKYDNYPPNSSKKELFTDEYFKFDSKEKLEEVLLQRITDNPETFFFYKNEDYKDENEFRIVVHTEDRYAYFDISECCKAIVLGSEVNDIYKRIYKYYKEKLNLKLGKIGWHNDILYIFEE